MMTIQMIRKLQGISMNTRQSITLFHTVINMREGGAMNFKNIFFSVDIFTWFYLMSYISYSNSSEQSFIPILIPRYQDAELEFIPEMVSSPLTVTLPPGHRVSFPCEVGHMATARDSLFWVSWQGSRCRMSPLSGSGCRPVCPGVDAGTHDALHRDHQA